MTTLSDVRRTSIYTNICTDLRCYKTYRLAMVIFHSFYSKSVPMTLFGQNGCDHESDLLLCLKKLHFNYNVNITVDICNNKYIVCKDFLYLSKYLTMVLLHIFLYFFFRIYLMHYILLQLFLL